MCSKFIWPVSGSVNECEANRISHFNCIIGSSPCYYLGLSYKMDFQSLRDYSLTENLLYLGISGCRGSQL